MPGTSTIFAGLKVGAPSMAPQPFPPRVSSSSGPRCRSIRRPWRICCSKAPLCPAASNLSRPRVACFFCCVKRCWRCWFRFLVIYQILVDNVDMNIKVQVGANSGSVRRDYKGNFPKAEIVILDYFVYFGRFTKMLERCHIPKASCASWNKTHRKSISIKADASSTKHPISQTPSVFSILRCMLYCSAFWTYHSQSFHFFLPWYWCRRSEVSSDRLLLVFS